MSSTAGNDTADDSMDEIKADPEQRPQGTSPPPLLGSHFEAGAEGKGNRLQSTHIGTTCGTNTLPDVRRQLLNIKLSALPRWAGGRSDPVPRCGAATTSKGVGGVTQYVDEGRVGGACLHAETRASLMEGERTRWAGPGTRAI